MKKGVLYYIFGLAAVSHNAARDAKHQPGITVKENFQGARIVGLQPGHYLFIGRTPAFGDFRRANRLSLQSIGHSSQRERASWRHRTHASFPVERLDADTLGKTPLHRPPPPAKSSLVFKTYTKTQRTQKFFR